MGKLSDFKNLRESFDALLAASFKRTGGATPSQEAASKQWFYAGAYAHHFLLQHAMDTGGKDGVDAKWDRLSRELIEWTGRVELGLEHPGTTEM